MIDEFQSPRTQSMVDFSIREARSDDFDAITSALTGSSLFPSTLWATDVTDWTVTLDDANPQQASLVSYRVTLPTGTMSDTAINASALRN